MKVALLFKVVEVITQNDDSERFFPLQYLFLDVHESYYRLYLSPACFAWFHGNEFLWSSTILKLTFYHYETCHMKEICCFCTLL